MTSEDEYAGRARKACLPCRKSKRRCDKKVPSCDLCIRKEVECSYPARHKASHTKVQHGPAWSLRTPDASPSEYNAHNNGREQPPGVPSLGKADANAIQYIAPRLFRQARLELPRPNLPVPADVSHLIGDAFAIRDMAATFFKTIHRWFPIISKQGFFACLLNPLTQRQTELSLLALCMKLSCTTPAGADGENDNKTGLYYVAKRYYHEVEIAGVQSIHVLQAGILIAIYELGQAIYPAAYLTVGACARFGLGLAINTLSKAPPGGVDERSWNEIEEKQRVWWAVLLLDRFLSLSDPARPLSTEDPTFDTYLPVDDTSWDDCTAKPGDAVRISNGFTLKMGSFARLSQATYLLSQALRETKTQSVEGNASHDRDTAQLRRTLLALVHATDKEVAVRRLELCAQSVLSLSTILLLQEYRFEEGDVGGDDDTTEPSLESLWFEARTALNRLSAAAVSYNVSCTITCSDTPDTSNHVPVFVMHAMYQSACILLRLSQGALDGELSDKIEAIKQWFQLVNSRWRLAGVYLRILEARQMTISSEIIKARFNVATS